MSRCFAQIFNMTRQLPVASRATVARAPWARMMGLLPRQGLEPGEGMIFPHCHAIHTFGMRFPIDVVFLDGETVVKVAAALPPGHTAAAPEADTVIELPAGAAVLAGIELGVKIRWDEPEKGLTLDAQVG